MKTYNADTNEGPQNNILVGQTSFGNEKLWPRTTFAPCIKRNNYTSFSITALKLPERWRRELACFGNADAVA